MWWFETAQDGRGKNYIPRVPKAWAHGMCQTFAEGRGTTKLRFRLHKYGIDSALDP